MMSMQGCLSLCDCRLHHDQIEEIEEFDTTSSLSLLSETDVYIVLMSLWMNRSSLISRVDSRFHELCLLSGY